jgi:trehalose 6-phosphate phosphatase
MEKIVMSIKADWIQHFTDDPRHSGIFLDFDGTISDIVPSPQTAGLNPRAAALIPRLARRYPLCILSGRRVAELAALVGIPHTHYVGVHGMEWMEDEPRIDPQVLPHLPMLDKARDELNSILPGLEGVTLEDKMLALSIHFRQVPGMEGKVVDLAEGLANTLGLKVSRGRMMVELRPPVDIDKGTVIIGMSRGWKLKRALYAGDDLTDVDAFRGLRRLMREGGFEGVAVAVLSGETPIELEAVADITVEGVEALLDLLDQL